MTPPGLRNRAANGVLEKTANGHANGHVTPQVTDQKTDYSRWRLLDERGRQRWRYLESDEAVNEWPQSTADKYFLGLDTNQPDLPPAKTPLHAVTNGLTFFSKLQLPPGNWGCEYGGPMFLLPGLVITWYVTETINTSHVPEAYKIEIRNYLFARQHPEDGGWGLHIEGESSAFGTALNYTALRLVGASANDPRMVKARKMLHSLGGALYGPHWAKFWLAVLGVMKWEAVNPVPPELLLLPSWVPIAPWGWWIHMRQVFLSMSFIWSKKWSYKATELTRQLKEELFPEQWESIDWPRHRNSIAVRDNYHPKSWLLNLINLLLVTIWIPFFRSASLIRKAEAFAYRMIQYENANTNYASLGPVNAAINLLACYIQEGPDSETVRQLRERADDFLWVKDEGMLMNGTNGVQNWDTAFLIQAVYEGGLAEDPRWKPMLTKALEYLEDAQIIEDCVEQEKCWRHPRKGAWGFSTRDQGYTVSDCVSECAKAVMQLQSTPGYPKLISDRRIKDGIDVILSMQNSTGGVSSYEPARGGEWLELLNAAEVFGRIMVEYDYPECTTSCVTAISLFTDLYPDYRKDDIARFKQDACKYIRNAQREDGSWYGAWGICFSYAAFFAFESLASVGEVYSNSEHVRRGCQFFLDRQMEDGGWGESYRSCEIGVYTQHEQSQVVQTAWVCIAMMHAEYPDKEPIRKALKMIMSRQQSNGEWLQEAIEGVFNKSCMISYPNYKFIFPVRALGMYAMKYGNEPLL